MARGKAKVHDTDDDTLVADINADMKKKLGDKCDVHVLGDGGFAAQATEWMPTGLTLLDAGLGGGIPIGRIVEVFGQEVSGKSLLITSMIASAQKAGAITALVDTEHAYTKEYVEKLTGADTHKIHYMDPEHLEDMWQACFDFIAIVRKKTDRPILLCIDSLAGMPTREEIEKDMDDASSIATAARCNKRALRKMTRELAMNRAVLVMTNQEIAKINALPWGEKTTTSGGGGPKYFSSVRLRMDHMGYLVEDKMRVGQKVQIVEYKTRFAGSGRKFECPILFASGFDDLGCCVNYLAQKGQLGTKKGYVSWGGEEYRTKDLKARLSTNAEERGQLQALAVQTYSCSGLEDEELGAETVAGE